MIDDLASSYTDSTAQVGAGLVIGIVVGAVLFLGFYILTSIALGKIFVKLGDQAWKAWVPLINTITILEKGGYSPLWVIALLIPAIDIVGLVVFILAINIVNARLGKGGGYTLLYVVCYPLWAILLGFGKSGQPGAQVGAAQTAFAAAGQPLPPAPGSAFAPAAPAFGAARPLAATSAPVLPAPPAPFSQARPAHSAPPAPPAFAAPPAPPVYSAPPAPPVYSAPPAPPAFSAGTSPAPFWVPAQPVAEPSTPPVAAQALPPRGLIPPPPAPPAAVVHSGGSADQWAPPPAVVVVPVARAMAAPVVAAPVVPAPVAPAASVQLAADEIADGDDFEATMIASRRVKPWILETEGGHRFPLTSTIVFVGRNPARTAGHPQAQLVSVTDPSKTVSKAHARLELTDGVWTIFDLNSTNGVVLIDAAGEERELASGAEALLTERFLLGELPTRIFLES